MSKEAMKLALEALEQLDGIDTETECVTFDVGEAITALREALAEQPTQQGHSCYCPNCEALSKELAELQAQKPIAWRVKWPAIGGGYKWMMVDSPLMEKEGFVNEALYGKAQALAEQPAQRKPLTDDFLRKLHHVDQFGLFCDYDEFEQIARAIEAAHGIKENT